MLKAKPNLESMIRTLKRDWAIVYDMLCGKDNSDFGWDKHTQMIVAENVVWNSYISVIGKNIRIVGLELRSIAFDKVIQESAQKLYPALCKVERLIEDECYCALSKILDHSMQMLIFFS
ncbi:hypothetical protein Gogos_015244, partial [Gossypium gossypioides]|nr:hypothetical protein [Gossypium gossypioides]